MRMTLPAACLAALLGLVPATSPVHAADDAAFTPAQVEALGKIIHEYIVKHPDVLMEAAQALQDREEAARESQVRDALKSLRKDLERDPETPVLGNPNGDITLVEFFDYKCGYCKKAYKDVMKSVTDDGKVRLVLKDLPILSQDSVDVSRAALAAHAQGRYGEFFAAALAHRGAYDEQAIHDIAKKIGLDVVRLKKDMDNPAIEKILDRNRELARALRVEGTPMFVVGDTLMPGMVTEAVLKEAFAKARRKTP
ncbi:MAG: DsbA family protein [Alphaproteobacteria bacterium]